MAVLAHLAHALSGGLRSEEHGGSSFGGKRSRVLLEICSEATDLCPRGMHTWFCQNLVKDFRVVVDLVKSFTRIVPRATADTAQPLV